MLGCSTPNPDGKQCPGDAVVDGCTGGGVRAGRTRLLQASHTHRTQRVLSLGAARATILIAVFFR